MNNNAVHYRKKSPPVHYRASRNSGRLRARFCALALLLVFSICTQEFVAPLRAFAAENAGVNDSGDKDSGTFFDQFFTDISLKVGDKNYNLLQNKKEREVPELPSMEIGSKVSVKYQFDIDQKYIDLELRQDAKGKKLLEAIENGADAGEEVPSEWVTAGEEYDFTMPKLFRDAVVEADNKIELKDGKDTLGEVSVDTGADTALITFSDEAFEEKGDISGWFQVEGTLTADGEGDDQPDKIILKFAEGIEVVIPIKTGESTYDIKKSWVKSYVDVAADETGKTDRRADKGSLVYEWQSEITVHPGKGLTSFIPEGLKLVDQYVEYGDTKNQKILDISGEMAPVNKSDVKVEKGTESKKEPVSEENYEVINSTEAGFTLRFTKQVDLEDGEKVWVTYQTKTKETFQKTINEVVAESGQNTPNQFIALKNKVTLWASDDKEGPSSEAERYIIKVNMLEKTNAKPAPTPEKNSYDYSVFVNWSTFNSVNKNNAGSGLSEGSYVGIPMNTKGQLDIEEELPSGTKLTGFVFKDGKTALTAYIDKTDRNNNGSTNNVYALMQEKQSDKSRYKVTIVEGEDEQHPILRIEALQTGDNYIDQVIPFNIRVKATNPNDPAIKGGVTNKVQLVLDETTYESESKLGNTGTQSLTKTGSFDWKTMQIQWTITANNFSGEGLTLVDTLGEGSTVTDVQTYVDKSLAITQDGAAVSAEAFDVSVDGKTIKITPKGDLNFGDGKKYVIMFSTKIDPNDIGKVAVNGDKVYQYNTVKLMKGESIAQSAKGDVVISKMGFSKKGGFIGDSKTSTQWNIDVDTGFSGRKDMVIYDQLKFTKNGAVDATQDWSTIFRPTAVRIFAVGPEEWKDGTGSPAELLKDKAPVYEQKISAADWQQIVNGTTASNDNTLTTGKLLSLWNFKNGWEGILPSPSSTLVLDLKNLPPETLKLISKDGNTINNFIRVQYDFACVEDNGEAKLAQYLTRSGANGMLNRAVCYVDGWVERFNAGPFPFGNYEQPLTKEGALTSGSTSNITWTVNLNKKNSQTISLPENASNMDMIFKDTFGSPNLMLDEDSIKVYRVTADGTDNGKTDGVNKFTSGMLSKEYVGKNCLSFSLNLADMAKEDRNEDGNWNSWYRIQYETFYYSDGNDAGSISVTNDASWSVIESGSTGGQVSAKVSDIKVQGGISLDKVGAIQITKTDEKTGRLLKGAVFTLYEVTAGGTKGAPISNATTNANGVAAFTELKVNSKYWLEETTPPQYYSIGEFEHVVTVNQSMKVGPVKVTVTNARIADAGLTVTKVEAGSNKTLQGAVFALQLTDSSEKNCFFKTDGTEVETVVEARVTTNADGKLVYTKLPHGTYSLIEVEAPKGYTIAKPTEGIVLNEKGVSVKVEDAKIVPKTGGFHFTKVDANGKLLDGAEFTLSKDGSVAATETSVSGQVIFKNILPGVYVLTETKAPEGYEKLDSTINVIIRADDNDGEAATSSNLPDGYTVKDEKLTVTNTATTGSLRIWKTNDAENAAPLIGAEFKLIGADGNKDVSLKGTTNVSGELEFAKLPLGKYTLTEVTAPTGYQLLAASVTVVVSKSGITVSGTDSGKIAVVEKDGAKWLQVKNTAESQFGNLRIWKTSDAEQAASLAGAVFELTGLEENKEILLNGTSTASGELVFAKLALGKYTLTEVTAPTGYQLLAAPVTVTVSKDGITVADVDAKKVAVVNRDGLQWLQVKNTAESQFDNLRIWKTSDAEQAASLAGAVFELNGSDENKAVSLKGTSNTSGELEFAKLTLGKYTLTEVTAPTGYQLLAAPVTVTVSKDGITVAGADSGTVAVVNRDGLQWLQIKNTAVPQPANLRIWKTSDTENTAALEGAVFELSGLDENKEVSLKATSGAFGELVFSKLPLGKYTLRELTAPTGYQLLAAPVTVTVSKDGITVADVDAKKVAVVTRDGLQWLQVKNTAEPQLANLRIWKTSDAEQATPLAGAEFALNGLEENEKISLKEKSNASGELEFARLPLGKYALTELTAPTGYQPLAAPVTVTVSKDGITVAGVDSGTAAVVTRDGLQWLQIKNTAELQLADFRVWKTSDTENTAVLEGAVFELTGLEENKEVSLKATSGASGELVFSKLPLGRYTLRELTAPAGYQLITAPIAVTLSKDDGMTVSGLGSDKIAVVERDGAKWLQVKNTPEKPQLVSLRIWKTNNAQNASPLAGAEFMLTGLDGNAAIELKATSNASGELEFANLPLGGYVLKELNAPSGYYLLSSPITVMISKENIAFSGVDANMVTAVDRGGIQWLQVKNNRKSSGGGGGGSTDRPSNNNGEDNNNTPPTDTVIIPIAPTETPLAEIPDNEVPLGGATPTIDEEPALPPDPIEISDEDVPLAGLPFVPKTGDSAARPIGLAALSALSLALIKVLRKRES